MSVIESGITGALGKSTYEAVPKGTFERAKAGRFPMGGAEGLTDAVTNLIPESAGGGKIATKAVETTRAINELPSALQEAIGRADMTIEGSVIKQLEIALTNRQVTGKQAETIIKRLESQLASAKSGGTGEAKFFKEAREKGLDKMTGQLITDVDTKFYDELVKLAEVATKAANEHADALVRIAKLTQSATNEAVKAEQQRFKHLQIRAQMNKKELSIADMDSTFQKRQEILVSGTGATAGSPASIATALREQQSKRLAAQKKIEEAPAPTTQAGWEGLGKLQKEFNDATVAVSNLSKAQEMLISPTEKLAFLQGKLSKAQSEREKKFGMVSDVLTGGPEKQIKFAQAMYTTAGISSKDIGGGEGSLERQKGVRFAQKNIDASMALARQMSDMKMAMFGTISQEEADLGRGKFGEMRTGRQFEEMVVAKQLEEQFIKGE
ncbi:uncharacterized protein METZ01_LOCUS264272, partial [marine metagenome]